MKTLLIKPSWSYPADPGDSTYNRNWPPLSLLNIASLLRDKNLPVDLIDASAEKMTLQEIADRASKADQVFITSASLDRWQCPNLNLTPFLKTVSEIKKVCQRIFIMGTHGSVRPKEILDMTEPTAVIRNEPEMTALEICLGKPLDQIPGITYYQNGTLVRQPDAEPIDMTVLPIPAYDLIDISKYQYEVLGDRFALLEASRGCPFDCMFCVKSMYGPGYRTKQVPQFLEEIDYIIDVVGARTAYFIDLEFTVNRKMAEAVSHHLISRGTPLQWCVQTRTDSVDLPLLKLMRQAGCRIIHYGIESGSEKIRQKLDKRITFEQMELGLKLSREAGLQTVCFFMFGLPDETPADMEETIRFAKKLNPTYASFHIALPYPGTRFHELVAEDVVGNLFPKAYTGIVPYQTLEAMAMRAFRSFYMRPRYIAGRLKDRDFKTFYRQARFFFSYLKHRLMS